MPYFGFPAYVSVSDLREKSLRAIKKLKKRGMIVKPIQLEKRTITHTFWGKAWCKHIESFSDFDNRLPRGRRYVRHGGVCHLTIDNEKISAKVIGSSLYDVDISIQPLSPHRWGLIKQKCAGQIGSLIELLQGDLSDAVMNIVCDQQEGLFPKPDEIKISCNCPDWAILCKHAAAVLYGVGVRLDQMPDQLFQLRSVNHEDLVDVSTVITDATQDQSVRRSIASSDLSDIFGIDIEDKNTQQTQNNEKALARLDKKKAIQYKKNSAKKNTKKNRKITASTPIRITGSKLKNKRRRLRLTQQQLSLTIGVSVSTISRWEKKGRKQLKLVGKPNESLQKFFSEQLQ